MPLSEEPGVGKTLTAESCELETLLQGETYFTH